MSLACALSLRFATIASNVPISRSDDWRTRAALTPPVQPLWPVVTYCSNISLNRTRGACQSDLNGRNGVGARLGLVS